MIQDHQKGCIFLSFQSLSCSRVTTSTRQVYCYTTIPSWQTKLGKSQKQSKKIQLPSSVTDERFVVFLFLTIELQYQRARWFLDYVSTCSLTTSKTQFPCQHVACMHACMQGAKACLINLGGVALESSRSSCHRPYYCDCIGTRRSVCGVLTSV